jgi:pilus assembly protein TadC
MAGLAVFLLLTSGAFLLTLPSGRHGSASTTTESRTVGQGIDDAPLLLDLIAAMLTAGASVESALSVVAEACDFDVGSSLTRVRAARILGASWEAAWEAGSTHDARRVGAPERHQRGRARSDARIIADIRQGLHFATSTGAPSAALLNAHAAQIRRHRKREIDRKVAALGVQLVLPLGLCSLPAFICLGVIPVVLGLLPAL